MRVRAFIWDDDNVAHIARHNVTPEEVEEAFEGRYRLHKGLESRYVLLGRTAAGRYLMIAFALRDGMARPITARDMSRAEKRRSQGDL